MNWHDVHESHNSSMNAKRHSLKKNSSMYKIQQRVNERLRKDRETEEEEEEDKY
jgi:hypothetical protein